MRILWTLSAFVPPTSATVRQNRLKFIFYSSGRYEERKLIFTFDQLFLCEYFDQLKTLLLLLLAKNKSSNSIWWRIFWAFDAQRSARNQIKRCCKIFYFKSDQMNLNLSFNLQDKYIYKCCCLAHQNKYFTFTFQKHNGASEGSLPQTSTVIPLVCLLFQSSITHVTWIASIHNSILCNDDYKQHFMYIHWRRHF